MKKKIYAFLAFMLISLSVAPIVNLNSETIFNKPKDIEWWDTSVLYNMDFALPLLGGLYYSLGISLSPEKVVIGKGGMLFLGDGYAKSISAKRVGATAESEALLDKVTGSANTWEAWFKKNGAKAYRVIIGPDKDTIYPELTPKWAVHAPLSLTDALMKRIGSDMYVNPTQSLLRAKEDFKDQLYFKTDTHWNSLGAWIAFSELSKNLARTQPEIIWPRVDLDNSLRVVTRKGGDLAKFQRIDSYLIDHEVVMDDFFKNPIPIEQYDFETGKLLSYGDNSGIEASKTPLLVKSRKALNHKKVLWLRDSFGYALSPFMAATFTETLQLHHASATPEILAKLVEKFKPDYVIATVVERDSRDGYFLLLPPMSISDSKSNFLPVTHASELKLNDFSPSDEPDTYRVSGIDPYVVFTLSKSIRPTAAGQIAFDLNCTDKADKIPVQLFWRAQNTDFSEQNSVYFSANTGVTSLDISVNPTWSKSKDIAEMRLDLVSPSGCPTAKIKDFEVGVTQSP